MRRARRSGTGTGRGRFGALLAALCLALGLNATPALGAGTTPSPFIPGIPQPQATVPTQTTPTVQTLGTTSTSTDTGLSGGGIAAIAIGALVILGGIAFYIWYDSRRRAPIRHRAVTDGAGLPGSGKTGSKQRAKPRKLSKAEQRRRKRGRARPR
ncbi:MAG: hypothetical protein QOG59_601 [Solirubrobacteraceae bacterium]|nr:hypothetical protein [Solirubrobacteraceae bacterium]